MWGIPGCKIKPLCNHPGDALLGKRDHLWLHLEERPGDWRGARSSSEFPSGSKMDSLLFLTKAFCRKHGVGLVENRWGSHFLILIEATSFNFTWKNLIKADQSLSTWSNLIKASNLIRVSNLIKSSQAGQQLSNLSGSFSGRQPFSGWQLFLYLIKSTANYTMRRENYQINLTLKAELDFFCVRFWCPACLQDRWFLE